MEWLINYYEYTNGLTQYPTKRPLNYDLMIVLYLLPIWSDWLITTSISMVLQNIHLKDLITKI